VQFAFRLWRDRSTRTAMRTFRYSIVYLFGVFLALMLDKAAHSWWPLW
jgi:heme O synthase-like polyprenyltransferase